MNKKELLILNRVFLFVVLSLISLSLLFSNCASLTSLDKVKFNIKKQSKGNLLRLQIYHPNSFDNADTNIYNILDENLLSETESKEKYGYYHYNMGYTIDENNILMYTLHSYTAFIFALFGVPTQLADVNLWISIDIFDSNGRLVKAFREEQNKTVAAGIGYGKYNPSSWYKKLFIKAIDAANRESSEVNRILLQAGPINSDNKIVSKQNMKEYYDRKTTQVASTYNTTPSNNSTTNTLNNISNTLIDAFSSPLESGTYGLSGGKDKVVMASIAKSGIFTHTDSSGTSRTGSYKIDENTIIINYPTGHTFTYRITSSRSFSGHGETWIKLY